MDQSGNSAPNRIDTCFLPPHTLQPLGIGSNRVFIVRDCSSAAERTPKSSGAARSRSYHSMLDSTDPGESSIVSLGLSRSLGNSCSVHYHIDIRGWLRKFRVKLHHLLPVLWHLLKRRSSPSLRVSALVTACCESWGATYRTSSSAKLFGNFHRNHY